MSNKPAWARKRKRQVSPFVLFCEPEIVFWCVHCDCEDHPPAWWRGASVCELNALARETEEPPAVTEGPSDETPDATRSRHD